MVIRKRHVLVAFVVVFAVPVATSRSDAGEDGREERLSGVQRVLGLSYPYEVWLHPPACDGGGVHGGFLADSTRIVDFAFDGEMKAVEFGSTVEPMRYLYLGASKVCAKARRLAIGSLEERAVREVFRFFCEDHLPPDSLAAHRDLPATSVDALRLKPVLEFLDKQAAREGGRHSSLSNQSLQLAAKIRWR